MNEINKNPMCSEIQDLLIKFSINKLTDQENQIVNEHLKLCEECSAYQNVLNEIPISLAVPGKSNLIPNPVISQLAAKRMKERKSMLTQSANNIWDSILSILNYRVPIYQAVFGMTFFFCVFFGLNRINFTANSMRGNFSETLQNKNNITILNDSLENILGIERWNVGISLHDDTVLTHFTVKAM